MITGHGDDSIKICNRLDPDACTPGGANGGISGGTTRKLRVGRGLSPPFRQSLCSQTKLKYQILMEYIIYTFFANILV